MFSDDMEITDTGFRIYAAPLQGFTEAVWRNCHAAVCGGIYGYFMPFMRVERGVSARDYCN